MAKSDNRGGSHILPTTEVVLATLPAAACLVQSPADALRPTLASLMHWSHRGGEAVMHARSLVVSGLWKGAWAAHVTPPEAPGQAAA